MWRRRDRGTLRSSAVVQRAVVTQAKRPTSPTEKARSNTDCDRSLAVVGDHVLKGAQPFQVLFAIK